MENQKRADIHKDTLDGTNNTTPAQWNELRADIERLRDKLRKAYERIEELQAETLKDDAELERLRIELKEQNCTHIACNTKEKAMKPNITDLAKLEAEVNQLQKTLLTAAAAYDQSPESFKAMIKASNEYVAKHRHWWTLTNPDGDYNKLYGG